MIDQRLCTADCGFKINNGNHKVCWHLNLTEYDLQIPGQVTAYRSHEGDYMVEATNRFEGNSSNSTSIFEATIWWSAHGYIGLHYPARNSWENRREHQRSGRIVSHSLFKCRNWVNIYRDSRIVAKTNWISFVRH